MSHVLGLVTHKLIATCEEEAARKNLTALPPWQEHFDAASIRIFHRYHWDHFIGYITEVDRYFGNHGISVLDIQKKLSPKLFDSILVARICNRAFSPAALLKSTDTWLGPFMFWVPTTQVLQSNDKAFHLVMNVDSQFQSSEVFFKHCLACFITTLNIYKYTDYMIEKKIIDKYRFEIKISFKQKKRVEVAPTTTQDFVNTLRHFNDDYLAKLINQDVEALDPQTKLAVLENIEELCRAARSMGTNSANLINALTTISASIQLLEEKSHPADQERRAQISAALSLLWQELQVLR